MLFCVLCRLYLLSPTVRNCYHNLPAQAPKTRFRHHYMSSRSRGGMALALFSNLLTGRNSGSTAAFDFLYLRTDDRCAVRYSTLDGQSPLDWERLAAFTHDLIGRDNGEKRVGVIVAVGRLNGCTRPLVTTAAPLRMGLREAACREQKHPLPWR